LGFLFGAVSGFVTEGKPVSATPAPLPELSAIPKTPGRPHDRDFDDVATAVPRHRMTRWVLAIIGLLVVTDAAVFLTNGRLGWGTVRQYMFNSLVLQGIVTTLELTAVAMFAGSIIGTLFAFARRSSFGVLRFTGWLYVWVIRSIPLLVQLLFWFNLAYLSPHLSIGIPHGPSFVSWSTNSLITPFVAASIGFSLFQGAQMCEIIRSGLISIDRGQHEAAAALGFSHAQTFRRIVCPQALRVILPPVGNSLLLLVEGTAIASIVGLNVLVYSVQQIYQDNLQVIPLLLVACLWYLILIAILSLFQGWLERRLSRGHVY
jgi:polar amino acid transport system permease protein